MYQRGTVVVEIKGGREGYSMVICLWYGGRWWWCGKWENGLNARMGCSGDSGGGAFLARILVYKGKEGRLSKTGWIIVE
eukprot:scaffold40658_cov47-Attheya_sp.AAC.1